MKLSFFTLSASLLGASAHPKPPKHADFSLVGFAKDNPLGPTTGGYHRYKGETVTVTTPAALISAVNGTTPRTIYLSGTFNLTARLAIGSNKSLIGTRKGATILSKGLNINSQSNVIIRNLGIRGIIGDDGITIRNSTRVWIDHNEFESGGFPALGPDTYDGQCDIIRASDWITVSWNYFHDHWKSSLVGNSDALRDVDLGHLHVTYHHNYWRNEGTRGPAGRFGHQHIYNNLYEDFLYQAIHSRSDNQVLVEGNDSPNTSPDGDYELDGFANLGARNDWGPATINITQVGNFTRVPYIYKLTPLKEMAKVVKAGAGLGKI
ncbi:pectin lyase-like protein [Bimuria novae-zelandiae CBS 107.79]|uniref:Pectin lyase-like protein n=1 Tax=Bimuria novae-zelandiae CBS 107.79 TaxID=1447943 RepID=A0A6A5VHR2_9PLEO|nr:pectin lyase-like protein [Bimuria novae-zelandiae CBS 107.79]